MITVTLDGVDIGLVQRIGRVGALFQRDILYAQQMSWNLVEGSSGTCQIPVICPPGDPFAPPVNPTAPVIIEIFETVLDSPPSTTRVWYGKLNKVGIQWLGPDGWHVITVSGTTPEMQLDTSFPNTSYLSNNPSARSYNPAVATRIYTTGELIADLASSAGIATGLIDGGVPVDGLHVGRASDAIATLANIYADQVWYVDPATGALNSHAIGSRPLPNEIVSEDVLYAQGQDTSSLQFTVDSSDFRNQQTVSAPPGTFTDINTGEIIHSSGASSTVGLGTVQYGWSLSTAVRQQGAADAAAALLGAYGGVPSKLTLATNRPGFSIGRDVTLNLDPDDPAGAYGLLNKQWHIQEVDAVLTDLAELDEPYGHFQYTLHLIDSTQVQTTQQAANQLTNVGPGGPGGGPTAGGGQSFLRTLLLHDTSVGTRVADSVPVMVQNGKTAHGIRVVAMLRIAISADLEVKISKSGIDFIDMTVPAATSVDDAIVASLLSGSPATYPVFNDLEPLVAQVFASGGEKDPSGVCSFTIEYQQDS